MNFAQLLEFCEFDEFYQHYSPLTCYGKNIKDKMHFFQTAEELEQEFSNTGVLLEYIQQNNESINKITYHLKRIPEIPILGDSTLNIADIFLFKKYLINYSFLCNLLPSNIANYFGLISPFTSLIILLNPNNSLTESFTLDETYSDNLASIRTKIRALDKKLFASKEKLLAEILNNCQLDFSLRDFILLDLSHSAKLPKNLLQIEVFDSSNLIVKPNYSSDYLQLCVQRNSLIEEEKKEEASVIKALSLEIQKFKYEFKASIISLMRFDTTLAKAKLVLGYNLTKPILTSIHEPIIEIKAGVYFPLAQKCKVQNIEYSALDFAPQKQIIVIRGSNMGGKTVILKTFIFLQLLTQMGFYVPATSFSTVVFHKIHAISSEIQTQISGLSSFGQEINSLINALHDLDKPTLIVIDEFARTTNSIEATALLSGLLKKLGRQNSTIALFATHFMQLATNSKVEFSRMGGLNHAKFAEIWNKDLNFTKQERLSLLNKCMEYKLLPDTASDNISDAIRVAEILGLDTEIIASAKEYLHEARLG